MELCTVFVIFPMVGYIGNNSVQHTIQKIQPGRRGRDPALRNGTTIYNKKRPWNLFWGPMAFSLRGFIFSPLYSAALLVAVGVVLILVLIPAAAVLLAVLLILVLILVIHLVILLNLVAVFPQG